MSHNDVLSTLTLSPQYLFEQPPRRYNWYAPQHCCKES